MIGKGISLFAALLIGLCLQAQNENTGEVKIVQDPRIDTLVSRYVEINDIHPAIKGWRIEIFFESGNLSKKKAMEAKSKFVEQFTDVPSYLTFQRPYYKVRVGDFRTKMEAEKFLHDIESNYPQAFIVKDEINFPQLD